MSDLKLTNVDAVHIGPRPLDWDSSRNHGSPRKQPRSQNRIARVVEGLLPDQDPSTVLVQLEQAEDGSVISVLLRDSRTGQLLLRLDPSMLNGEPDESGTTGMLVEWSG